MNANEKMLAGYADAELIILMLMVILEFLNSCYIDNDADLCIKIVFL